MMGGGGMFGGRGRMNGGMPDDTEDGMSSGMFGGHGRMKGTPA